MARFLATREFNSSLENIQSQSVKDWVSGFMSKYLDNYNFQFEADVHKSRIALSNLFQIIARVEYLGKNDEAQKQTIDPILENLARRKFGQATEVSIQLNTQFEEEAKAAEDEDEQQLRIDRDKVKKFKVDINEFKHEGKGADDEDEPDVGPKI